MLIPVRFSLFLAPEHLRGLVHIFESILDRRLDLIAILPVVPSRNKNEIRINLTSGEQLLRKILATLAVTPVPL